MTDEDALTARNSHYVSVGFVAAAFVLARHDFEKQPLHLGDFIAFGVVGGLGWWLWSSGRRGQERNANGEAAPEQGAGEKIALRLGQAVGRVWRRVRG